MAILSWDDAAEILLDVGFKPAEAVVMLAIGTAESGRDTDAKSPTNDFGWLQIHSALSAGPPGWRNPAVNAGYAKTKHNTQGFNAWCTYYPTGCGGAAGKKPKSASHLPHLSRALQSVTRFAFIAADDPLIKREQAKAKDVPQKDETGGVPGAGPRQGEFPSLPVIAQLESLVRFFDVLTEGETWIRILLFLGGLAAIAAGIYVVAKEQAVSIASDVLGG